MRMYIYTPLMQIYGPFDFIQVSVWVGFILFRTKVKIEQICLNV